MLALTLVIVGVLGQEEYGAPPLQGRGQGIISGSSGGSSGRCVSFILKTKSKPSVVTIYV